MTYRIKWEALEDKEVRKQFASSISSKFRQLPDVSEDIEREWLLFRAAIISSAAASCGRERFRVAGDSEKRTRWWNQEVKEGIRAEKDTFKALLLDRSPSDLQSHYTKAQKAATLAVNKSKKSWKEFGCRLDSNYFSANKVFSLTIRRLRCKKSSVTYSIKDSDGNILTDDNEILSRWREYFEDLLNPVKASTRDTHEVTHLGEEEVFTAAEVPTAIKGIKSGKAAGEDRKSDPRCWKRWPEKEFSG